MNPVLSWAAHSAAYGVGLVIAYPFFYRGRGVRKSALAMIAALGGAIAVLMERLFGHGPFFSVNIVIVLVLLIHWATNDDDDDDEGKLERTREWKIRKLIQVQDHS